MKRALLRFTTTFSILTVFTACDVGKEFTHEPYKEIHRRLGKKDDLYPTNRIEGALRQVEFLTALINHNEHKFQKLRHDYFAPMDRQHADEMKEIMECLFPRREDFFYTPATANEVYQICLVPGFFIRTCDNYTPVIAKTIKQSIRNHRPDAAVETAVMSRWDGYNLNHHDDTKFKTQYRVLSRHVERKIKELRTKYGKDTKIHLIFVCESYGGKITLFFLNKFLKERTDDKNISIDDFITVHSPLYGMVLTRFLLGKTIVPKGSKDDAKISSIQPKFDQHLKELWDHPTFNLLRSFLDTDIFELLNVEKYKTTYNILSEDNLIDDCDNKQKEVSPDDAMEYLANSGVNMFHFIGTPDDVVIMGQQVSYQVIYKSLDFLKNYLCDDKGQYKENNWKSLDAACRTLTDIFTELKKQAAKPNNQAIMIWLRILYATPLGKYVHAIGDMQTREETIESLKNFFASLKIDEDSYAKWELPSLFKCLAHIVADLVPFFKENLPKSDMVVCVNETTKDEDIIEKISAQRDEVQAFDKTIGDKKTMTIISSPHIYHVEGYMKEGTLLSDLNTYFLPRFNEQFPKNEQQQNEQPSNNCLDF